MKDFLTQMLWGLGRSHSPCFISGSPRSGTTWIMETLEKISDVRIHWEPLNWYMYAIEHGRLKGSQSKLRPDVQLLSQNAAYASELMRILGGGSPRRAAMARISRLSQIDNAKRILTARNTIVKFVYAQRALPWMVENSDVKGCVILRHPMSVVASQIFHPYRSNGASWQHPEWTVDVIEKTHPIYTDQDLILYPNLEKVLRLNLKPEGRLAITAALDLLHPLRDAKVRQTYAFVAYEKLQTSPDSFVKMALALGLPLIHEPSVEILQQRSRTTSVQSKTGKSGVTRLDADSRKQIQEIVEALELDFYQADGSVNVTSLRSLDFGNLITDES